MQSVEPFYGWQSANAAPVCPAYAAVRSPVHLFEILSKLWSRQTCAPRMQSAWQTDRPTLGQCSITAFLCQDIFGGVVRGIPLPDGSVHCYNVTQGCVFDLTSAQFLPEVLTYADDPVQSRESHFAKEEKRLRYEMLKAKLTEYLRESSK